MDENRLRSLEVIVFGPPTLEDKLRGYIDERDEHKARNALQDIIDLKDDFKEEKKHRESQHSDNQTQFRQLFRLVWIGVGIVITLQLVLLVLVGLFRH